MHLNVSPDDNLSPSVIEDSPLFRNWRWCVAGLDIGEVRIHNVVMNRDGEILIIQMSAQHNGINYALLLRQASVDILTVLRCEGRQYVLHVTQPRIALGATVRSNAAGMIEFGETPFDAAQRELDQETDDRLRGKIISLNDLALGGRVAMAVSPGATNELVYFFARVVDVTPELIDELRGAARGLDDEDERIIVDVTEFKHRVTELIPTLPQAGVPDMKFVLSLALYHLYVELLAA